MTLHQRDGFFLKRKPITRAFVGLEDHSSRAKEQKSRLDQVQVWKITVRSRRVVIQPLALSAYREVLQFSLVSPQFWPTVREPRILLVEVESLVFASNLLFPFSYDCVIHQSVLSTSSPCFNSFGFALPFPSSPKLSLSGLRLPERKSLGPTTSCPKTNSQYLLRTARMQ